MNNIKNTSWSFYTDQQPTYSYYENCFSSDECAKIINLAKKIPLQKAKVGTKEKETVDVKIRKSNIKWIFPTNETKFIFERLTSIITYLNNKYYGFNLFSMSEGLQFTNYKAPSGHYGKHIDKLSNGNVIRKMSVTVQLSDPNKYEGGELNLYESDEPIKTSKEQGMLIMFPSYTLHQVTPVTKGERNSLVCWITGEPLK